MARRPRRPPRSGTAWFPRHTQSATTGRQPGPSRYALPPIPVGFSFPQSRRDDLFVATRPTATPQHRRCGMAAERESPTSTPPLARVVARPLWKDLFPYGLLDTGLHRRTPAPKPVHNRPVLKSGRTDSPCLCQRASARVSAPKTNPPTPGRALPLGYASDCIREAPSSVNSIRRALPAWSSRFSVFPKPNSRVPWGMLQS